MISANVLESLDLVTTVPRDRIGGVGGLVESVSVNTQIRLSRDNGQKAVFRGEYCACTDHEALDMSVLGRDILEMFALIVDRKSDLVVMLGGQHIYAIAMQ